MTAARGIREGRTDEGTWALDDLSRYPDADEPDLLEGLPEGTATPTQTAGGTYGSAVAYRDAAR